MRSGVIIIHDGRLGSAGIVGYSSPASAAFKIWSSAGLGMYRLDFNTAKVSPSYGPDSREYGFPLRGLGSKGESCSDVHLDHPMSKCCQYRTRGDMT